MDGNQATCVDGEKASNKGVLQRGRGGTDEGADGGRMGRAVESLDWRLVGRMFLYSLYVCVGGRIMAQVYKMMLGTSGRQWEQLTVREDGTMMLYFHGTDRSVTQQVTAVTEGEWKGWLRSDGGSLYPGIESGKWQLMDDVRGLTADVVETNTNDTNNTNEVAESETTTDNTDCTDNYAEQAVIEETTNCTNYTNNEPVTNNREPLTMNHDCRPRRQRKPRKPRVERQEPLTIDHSPLNIDHQPSDIDHQPSSTLKAIGMVAAATVALFVIYETGLLIPLGLIGLATGGILK